MVFKQSFKFLNSLSFSLKHEVMLFIRQSHKVLRAVVGSYAIQVMCNPTIRERFAMRLFPDKNVLKDITSMASSWMIGLVNPCISLRHKSATFPSMSAPTSLLAHKNTMASFAPFRFPRTWLPTVQAFPGQCAYHKTNIADTPNHVKLLELSIVWGILIGGYGIWIVQSIW